MVNKITPDGLPELGMVEVATTKFGGHPPEFWAEQLTDKICGYSDNSEPHIKEQARAYKDLIYGVCLIYLNNAIKSYKASLIQELLKAGEEDLAKIIKRT
jgi:DNA-directed RNA polymerase delta subunit|tara:strand:- start:324 stop:623 length:300 start_codon:yes stop_codon:yes gene_type:complete